MGFKESRVNDECWAAMGREDEASTSSRARLTPEMAQLSQTIEGEIIPRLLVMFDDSRASTDVVDDSWDNARLTGEVDAFVELILNNTIDVATRYITTLVDDGARLRDIYLALLAPAARRLGVMWEDDDCDFTQVTVGVARMHQILHMFSPCFCAHPTSESDHTRSALIVPMPGEQHTFGHLMVVEFFRRAGWHVWSGAPGTTKAIIELVTEQEFDIIGVSISADRHLDRLAGLLRNIRRQSAHKGVRILVGGRAFLETDRKAEDYGADGFANDGEEAVRTASSFQ
ncbi:MAG: cobalamin B12-binding domain-containing protein [Pseudomonadota bacterium]